MSKEEDSKLPSREGARTLIYLVDDEPMLLELTKLILAPLGYDIETFRDPEQALEAFRSAQPRPDVIVTDYAMSSMNGLALMGGCRAIKPDQRVLLVSGTTDEGVFENAPDKPNLFLAKPYQPVQLIRLVKELAEP